MKKFEYIVQVEWTGNTGNGTTDYKSYERSHIITAQDKPALHCSAEPAFRGDTTKWNPEELLLASISSCHMLWYLHLCAENKINVQKYEDSPYGTMELESGGKGKFTKVILKPKIKITDTTKKELARDLHEKAHEFCFIANSLNFPVEIEPEIVF